MLYQNSFKESGGVGSRKDTEGGVGMVLTRDGTDVAPEIGGSNNSNNKLGVIVGKPWQQKSMEQRMKAETVGLPTSAVQKKDLFQYIFM